MKRSESASGTASASDKRARVEIEYPHEKIFEVLRIGKQLDGSLGSGEGVQYATPTAALLLETVQSLLREWQGAFRLSEAESLNVIGKD